MDGLGSDFIGAILRSGPLWVGTSGGPEPVLQDELFTNYTVQQGLSNNTVTAIAQDTTGTLWLGTNGGGLNRLRREAAIQALSLGFPGVAGHHLRHARGCRRHALAQFQDRDLPGLDRRS